MEAVIGLLNSFMLAGSVTFAGSGSVSGAGMLIGILAFCVVVFVVQRIRRVSTAFRVMMPIIASLLVFLPFLGEQFNLFFSTVLLGGYYFIALLITYVVAETAHVRNLSPYVLMGAAACLARVCSAAALLGGHAIGSLPGGLFGESEHIMRLSGGHHGRDLRAVGLAAALSVARPAPPTPGRRGCGVLGCCGGPGRVRRRRRLRPGRRRGGGRQRRVRRRRCAAVAAAGGLTEREAEIMRHLARGRTKADIAGVLFVSEKTVRSDAAQHLCQARGRDPPAGSSTSWRKSAARTAAARLPADR